MKIQMLPKAPNWAAPDLCLYEEAGLLHRDAGLSAVVQSHSGSLAHLVTPWPGAQPEDRSRMAARGAEWSRWMAALGLTVVAPIVQIAAIQSEDCDAGVSCDGLCPADLAGWQHWSIPIAAACAGLIVPPLPGWDCCPWVWSHVRDALLRNRRVSLIQPGFGIGGAL